MNKRIGLAGVLLLGGLLTACAGGTAVSTTKPAVTPTATAVASATPTETPIATAAPSAAVSGLPAAGNFLGFGTVVDYPSASTVRVRIDPNATSAFAGQTLTFRADAKTVFTVATKDKSIAGVNAKIGDAVGLSFNKQSLAADGSYLLSSYFLKP